MAPVTCSIDIRDYSRRVRIGCTTDERAKAQELKISVKLTFEETLPACESDKLADTLCYDKVCKTIDAACDAEFNTLERITARVVDEIRKNFDRKMAVTVRVCKVNPPVVGLGGVCFEIETPGSA